MAADMPRNEDGMVKLISAKPMVEKRHRKSSTIAIFAVIALMAPTGDISAKQARRAPTSETTAPREAGEPIMAIVSIKSQQVTFYDTEGWTLRAPVSTGVKERETPAGVFAIVEKDKDHHSTMYDDAWMPNMQRITWNGLALHGGPLPGYAASHGCVRMPYGIAEKLFEKTRIGMRVIISPEDAAPVDFSHRALLLFEPNAEVIAVAPTKAETLAREAVDAAKMAEEAKRNAMTTARDSAPLATSLRKLERLKNLADADLVSAEKAAAKTDQTITKAEDRQKKAAAKAAELGAQFDTAKAYATSKLDAARAAKEAAKTAQIKEIETSKAALDAKLALEPVSIYISRATRKLYVRRNTHKPAPDGGGEVFDATIEAPVTIRDPGKPLGTHVFTAMARNEPGLRWTAVTIENADDAKNALDRITIPKEILDRFAPTTLPRSSIVVSDEPLSEETNYRTEFVAVLSDQPQGGFITRKPSEVIVADDNGWGNGNRQDDDGFGIFFPRSPNPQSKATRRGGGQFFPPFQRGW
jgi:lipoprotein-anchoring transpeptidase ErfK/SrfK